MKGRELCFLGAGVLLGAATWASWTWISGTTEPAVHSGPSRDAGAASVVGGTRIPRPAPSPADSPRSTTPICDGRDPPREEVASGDSLSSLQAEVARLASNQGPASGTAAEKRPGFAGSPYARMDSALLAELRAAAEKEVAPLLEAWRTAATGPDRGAAMVRLSMPLHRLLATGGGLEHLSLLEESAERGETAEERRRAVIATHTLWQPQVVDFLLARTRSPHADVRFYAVEGLAWVRGAEETRAIDAVEAALEDADADVRSAAATSLAVVVADPARADAILRRLARETDPGAGRSLEAAVRRLDPANGADRVKVATGK